MHRVFLRHAEEHDRNRCGAEHPPANAYQHQIHDKVAGSACRTYLEEVERGRARRAVSHAPQVECQPIAVFATVAVAISVAFGAIATLSTATVVVAVMVVDADHNIAVAATAAVVGASTIDAIVVLPHGCVRADDGITAATAFPPPHDAHGLEVLSCNRPGQGGPHAPSLAISEKFASGVKKIQRGVGHTEFGKASFMFSYIFGRIVALWGFAWFLSKQFTSILGKVLQKPGHISDKSGS